MQYTLTRSMKLKAYSTCLVKSPTDFSYTFSPFRASLSFKDREG